MTKKILLVWIALLSLASCHDEGGNPAPEPIVCEETLIMFFPWSGSGQSSLMTEFLSDINEMERAVVNAGGLGNTRLLVAIASSTTLMNVIELTYNGSACQRDTLATLTLGQDYASSTRAMLRRIISVSPARHYSMTIGCHGMGWLPKGTVVDTPYSLNARQSIRTRFIGPNTQQYQISIEELASAIKSSGIHLEYLLFDDCYMANVEVAWTLREICDYLIGSTSEIMQGGMPYDVIGKSLLNHDYEAVCQGIHDTYSTSPYPYNTVSVIKSDEVEVTASLMQQINQAFEWDENKTDEVQSLDGYAPTVFFDMGSYIHHLCTDPLLFSQMEEQMKWLVPYSKHTDFYPSEFYKHGGTATSGGIYIYPITAFSGITISDLSTNKAVTSNKVQTEWWTTTHNRQ